MGIRGWLGCPRFRRFIGPALSETGNAHVLQLKEASPRIRATQAAGATSPLRSEQAGRAYRELTICCRPSADRYSCLGAAHDDKFRRL